MDRFTATVTVLPDGRDALVLQYVPVSSTGLVCDAAALTAALEAAGRSVAVILLVPDGVDVERTRQAAVACTAASPVLATRAPVTDAVKRVDGTVVTATLDRSQLAWAVGPAAIHTTALTGVLAAVEGRPVRPLVAPDAPLEWW